MWPRNIRIQGIDVPVYSLDELHSLIQQYGDSHAPSDKPPGEPIKKKANVSLSNSDRALLERFVEGGKRGLSNKELADALNKQGKSIRPALEAYGIRVGLLEEGFAFVAVVRADGRGYRLNDHALRVAHSVLEG